MLIFYEHLISLLECFKSACNHSDINFSGLCRVRFEFNELILDVSVILRILRGGGDVAFCGSPPGRYVLWLIPGMQSSYTPPPHLLPNLLNDK